MSFFKDFHGEIKMLVIIFIIAIVVSIGAILILKSLPSSIQVQPESQQVNVEVQPMEEPTKLDIANWQTYRNEEFGFEFQYPDDWQVNESKEPYFTGLVVRPKAKEGERNDLAVIIREYDDESHQSKRTIDKIQVLENILEKFPRVVRQLKERRKEKDIPRPTLEVKDEYDVQDLLCSLLKINFEIVKKEIGTEHHAGGTARMDLVLDDEEIIIEVKMVRKDHTLKKLADELIVDIERYLEKYSCKFLYFFIYDPTNILPNLQELVNDINRTKNDTIIKVIFVPSK